MKTLITGAAGRLGAAIAGHLHQKGFDCIATDIAENPELPSAFEQADLRDRKSCQALVNNVDAVVHFGNIPGQGSRDMETVLLDNTAMNANLLQASAEAGTRKIIFASSIQVTGDLSNFERPGSPSEIAYLPFDDAMPPRPGSGYALSKLFGEELLKHLSIKWNIDCISLRIPRCEHSETRKACSIFDSFDEGNFDRGGFYLHPSDLSTLVEAILKTDLPGYRSYLPSDHTWLFKESPEEAASKIFAGVPHKCPPSQWQGLRLPCKAIQETGWEPAQNVPLEFAS